LGTASTRRDRFAITPFGPRKTKNNLSFGAIALRAYLAARVCAFAR
jgi:hypothetical protein